MINLTHPQLLQNQSFPLIEDGSLGDRHLLFTGYPYQRQRAWIHYIPTSSMRPHPPAGITYLPIFVRPRPDGDPLWLSLGERGSFASDLLHNLRVFHDKAFDQAILLRPTAKWYPRMPKFGNRIPWSSLEGTGEYRQMIINLLNVQRCKATGWHYD